jgi:quercetin dioxygenase-like cupin family protein
VSEELALSPGTTVRVVQQTDEVLDVEARYTAHGTPPPPHFHPAQDERFEVRAGAMHAIVAGEERVLAAGDVLEIPRGTPHQMWNDDDEEAVLSWRTSPSLRTLDWFRGLAGLQRGEGDLPTLLAEYGDVVRFGAGPAA